MSHKVAFKPEADNDVALAMEWYAGQRDGLELEFADELENAIRLIASRPERFGKIHPDIRRAPLGRFPYFIAYEQEAAEIIVYRVLHNKQDRTNRF